MRNLLSIGHPPRHDELPDPALELLGVVVEDGSGREGVDGGLSARPVAGEPERKPVNACLARRVGRKRSERQAFVDPVMRPVQRIHGRDVGQDREVPPRDLAVHLARDQEGPGEIGLKRPVPIVEGRVRQIREVGAGAQQQIPGDGGVVESDIGLAGSTTMSCWSS